MFNQEGDRIDNGEYGYISLLKDGFAQARLRGGLKVIIDSSGRILNNKFYESVSFFEENAALVLEKIGGKCVYYFVDHRGRQTSDNLCEEIDFTIYRTTGIIAAQMKEENEPSLKYYLIDKRREKTNKKSFDYLELGRKDLGGTESETIIAGTTIGKNNMKYYLLDKEGNQISEEYDEVSGFNEGVASVKIGNRAFLINEKGERMEEIAIRYQT